MSHFYGRMRGTGKTESTRCGSKQSGINAHICAWDHGIRINIDHVGGKDWVRVYRTGGSNNSAEHVLIHEYLYEYFK